MKASLLFIFLIISYSHAAVDPQLQCGNLEWKFFSSLVSHPTDAIKISKKRRFQKNCVNSDLRTPLTAAIQYGEEEVVQNLLNLGADPNLQIQVDKCISGLARHRNGSTALHVAYDNPGIAMALLKSGAKTDIQNGCGKTPVHFAADLFGDNEVLKLQLEVSKKPLFIPDHLGCLPLHDAVASLASSKVEIIFDALSTVEKNEQFASKCDFYHDGRPSMTAYDLATIKGGRVIQKIKIIRLFFENGADPTQAIRAVIYAGDIDLLKELVAAGGEIKSQDLIDLCGYGSTFADGELFDFALKNFEYSPKTLTLALNALVSDEENAWRERSILMAKELIDRGANPKFVPKYGESLMTLAYRPCRYRSNCKLFNFLEQYTKESDLK